MMRLRGLGEIVERIDALLVDQFGVLIDGARLYPQAREALERLRAAGKPALLVSNSGKRSAANVLRLDRLGLARELYLDVLTSGEIAHAEVARRYGRGRRVWIETTDDTESPLEGLDLERTDDPARADLVWIAGCRPWARAIEDYAGLLRAAAARGVPALCSNPDLTMLTQEGRAFGAGRVGELYERLGGRVDWIGKPHASIYDEAMRRLAGVARARVLAVGDSPAHDILGGARAGLRTALVRTGVHEDDDEQAVLARCLKVGATPDYLMPRFAF